MSVRARFLSAWNGVATIIFFAGIFLDFEVMGYSGVMFGIFMWIIGGFIVNLLFGPKKKDSRTQFSNRRRRRTSSSSYENSNYNIVKTDEFCIACGNKISDGEGYCSNCGTAVTGFVNK